jgi:hypothetical protein
MVVPTSGLRDGKIRKKDVFGDGSSYERRSAVATGREPVLVVETGVTL